MLQTKKRQKGRYFMISHTWNILENKVEQFSRSWVDDDAIYMLETGSDSKWTIFLVHFIYYMYVCV